MEIIFQWRRTDDKHIYVYHLLCNTVISSVMGTKDSKNGIAQFIQGGQGKFH